MEVHPPPGALGLAAACLARFSGPEASLPTLESAATAARFALVEGLGFRVLGSGLGPEDAGSLGEGPEAVGRDSALEAATAPSARFLFLPSFTNGTFIGTGEFRCLSALLLD